LAWTLSDGGHQGKEGQRRQAVSVFYLKLTSFPFDSTLFSSLYFHLLQVVESIVSELSLSSTITACSALTLTPTSTQRSNLLALLASQASPSARAAVLHRPPETSSALAAATRCNYKKTSTPNKSHKKKKKKKSNILFFFFF